MGAVSWILTFALLIGQLIKIPQGTQGGVTFLDITTLFLSLVGINLLRSDLKNPPFFIKAIAPFILVAIISLIFTPLNLGLNELIISALYIVRLSIYFLFGWVIYKGAFDSFKHIEKVLLLSGIGLALLGILQVIFLPNLSFLIEEGWDPHYMRSVSTLLDPNFLGAFLVLTMILFFTHYPFFWKKWYLITFLLVYLAFITTFSRSSALMLFVSLSTLSFLKRSYYLFLVTLLLIAGFILGYSLYFKSVAQPRNISRDKSAKLRINTWQQGITLFQNAPILGVGFNAYRYSIEEYNLAPKEFVQSRGASGNDSSLLFVLATTGLIGLYAYFFFIFSLLKVFLKNQTSWGFSLMSGFLGLLVHSFFANSLFYMWSLLWIILISTKIKKSP